MIKETDYIIYFDSLLAGDKIKCVETVKRLLGEGAGIKEIYFDLIQRSMYRIGRLWDRQKIGIASERIATDISNTVIGLLYPLISAAPKNGLKIIITCIDKEHHSIGARIVADIFELNGWKTFFLGACMPCCEILKSVYEIKPDVVGISSNFNLNLPRLIRLIEEIKREHPLQEIIIGGQIFSGGGEEIVEKYKSVKYVSSLKMLDKYIKMKNKTAPGNKI